VLKSDQNGIETFVKKEFANFFLIMLKSDQNGIETLAIV